jgi:3-deoxy-manno-octulosonate cytidylyltransferase (CMP-KDO synthetase)
MTPPDSPIIVIPSRLAAQRLPGKPLADIHGEPMIVHVWRRAIESCVGRVVVACADAEIAKAISAAGGDAVMTRSDHPSGSDRIFEAVQAVDPDGTHGAVINLQGDLPTIAGDVIHTALRPLDDGAVDIGTVACAITEALFYAHAGTRRRGPIVAPYRHLRIPPRRAGAICRPSPRTP